MGIVCLFRYLLFLEILSVPSYIPTPIPLVLEPFALPRRRWTADDWHVGPDSVEHLYTYARPEFEMRHGAKQAAIEAMRGRQAVRDERKGKTMMDTMLYVCGLAH